MSIDQWLLKFDPANFSFSVLVFIILVSSICFIFTRFWPWYTKEYFPARQKAELQRLDVEARQEQTRLDVMAAIRDALVELKVLVSQNSAMTSSIIEHLDRMPAAVRNRRANHNGERRS